MNPVHNYLRKLLKVAGESLLACIKRRKLQLNFALFDLLYEYMQGGAEKEEVRVL